MNFIKELWHGERRLVFTFWVMGFILPNTFTIVRMGGSYFEIDSEVNRTLVFCVEAGLYLYMAFIGVAIWRSAKAYKVAVRITDPYFDLYINWGTMAQLFVVLIYASIFNLLVISNVFSFERWL